MATGTMLEELQADLGLTDHTIRAFLRGVRNKQSKLDAMREFFLGRLTGRSEWLQPYIREFFPAKEVRGTPAGKQRPAKR